MFLGVGTADGVGLMAVTTGVAVGLLTVTAGVAVGLLAVATGVATLSVGPVIVAALSPQASDPRAARSAIETIQRDPFMTHLLRRR